MCEEFDARIAVAPHSDASWVKIFRLMARSSVAASMTRLAPASCA